jgi:hypothetical protein
LVRMKIPRRSSMPRSSGDSIDFEAIGKALANAPRASCSPSMTTIATCGSGSTRSPRPRARTGDEIRERSPSRSSWSRRRHVRNGRAAAYARQRAGTVRIAIHENRPGGNDLAELRGSRECRDRPLSRSGRYRFTPGFMTWAAPAPWPRG